MRGKEKLVSRVDKVRFRWNGKHSAAVMTWTEPSLWKQRGESPSGLITPGRVTVKLRSAIRLVFVTMLCGQFCHSLGCNAIHLEPIVCAPSPNWNIDYPPPLPLPGAAPQTVGKILGMDHKLIPRPPMFCRGEMKFECASLGPLTPKDCDLFQWQGLLLKVCIDVGMQTGNSRLPPALSAEGRLLHAT